jgi:DNA-binding IclR family transcriptional regulator
MALYIKKEGSMGSIGYSWNVGQPSPIIDTAISTITYIQADGDELELILNSFCTNPHANHTSRHYTIPVAKERVMKWYGDIARTIIANIF